MNRNVDDWSVLSNTEKYNFLGISIVGQSNERGDGGIYIGSIMKGGAVAADGRIEPGDMLLQVRSSGGQAEAVIPFRIRLEYLDKFCLAKMATAAVNIVVVISGQHHVRDVRLASW